MKRIGIVGAGQMGTGIGIVAASVAGIPVKIVELNDASLKRSQKFIVSWCDKEVLKKRMTEDKKKDTLAKITFHNNIN